MKKSINNQGAFNYLLAAIFLLVGLAIGYFGNNLFQTNTVSAQTIEQAKNEISDLYKDKAVDACWQVNNGDNLADGKYELTYRNIRINNQANRAIITDCGENSTLLAKNNTGNWIPTNVNLTVSGRLNPIWQKRCGIEDITVADDVVRPENQSIDEANLIECTKIQQQ